MADSIAQCKIFLYELLLNGFTTVAGESVFFHEKF